MRGGALPSRDELIAMVERRADQTPAARLQAAIQLGRDLSDSGDALIERFVGEARADGLSWTQIGTLFGTSKQAAQQRYGTVDEPGIWPGRWTAEAHHVLDAAAQYAREFHHDYLGTEHVLIAILTTPGSAAGQALLDLGVVPDGVLAELAAASCEPRRSDCYRLMPRLKQALDHAQRLATGLQDQTADTAHLLAGILNVPDALAVRVLARQGVTVDAARAALARRLEIDPQQLVVPRARRRRLLVRQ